MKKAEIFQLMHGFKKKSDIGKDSEKIFLVNYVQLHVFITKLRYLKKVLIFVRL